MCCKVLLAHEATMATTQLTRAAALEICWPPPEEETGFKPLRMNWVVVTDKNGNRQLGMSWRAERDG